MKTLEQITEIIYQEHIKPLEDNIRLLEKQNATYREMTAKLKTENENLRKLLNTERTKKGR